MTCWPISGTRPAATLALALGLALTAPLTARADDDCYVPIGDWADQETALATISERWGVQPQRLRIDDGCYEVKTYDADGNRLSLKLDPQTLEPVEMEVKFRPGADPARYLAAVRGEGESRSVPAEATVPDD